MNSPIDLLNTLANRGIRLSAVAGRLDCYAPEGALTSEIRDEIQRHRTEIVALFETREKLQQCGAESVTSNQPWEFPLSAGQKGLYILHKLYPRLSAYNVPICLKIKDEVNKEALAAAWKLTLQRYPILTARIIERDGSLYHLLDDGNKVGMREIHVRSEGGQELLSLLRKWARAPFDLNQGPLARCELVTQDCQNAVLLVTVHHIVFDGASAMILLRSFIEYYRKCCAGVRVRLAQGVPGFAEFVAWEEEMLASAEGMEHGLYWKQQLDGDLPTLELLPDLPRPASSFEGNRLVKEVPKDVSAWISVFSKARSVPPSAIFLAVLKILLYRYTGLDDIIVGMPVMGRIEQRFSSDIGYFINMVPVRTRMEAQVTWNDFLVRIQCTMLDALYHSSYPFPLMVEAVKLKQGGKSPVFQVAYAYQNFVSAEDFRRLTQQQGLQMEVVPGVSQEGDFDLGLEIFENGKLFSTHFKYNPELYRESTASRFLDHYHALLQAVSQSPDLLLHQYCFTSAAEREQVLRGFNATSCSYPSERCLHDFFVDRALLCPTAVAARYGQSCLTYGELYERSGALGVYLQSLGVCADAIVGVCVERSLEMMVALVGSVRSGAAYLPADPDYPDDRLEYMLHDSGARVVLTQHRFSARLRRLLGEDVKLICLDAEWGAIAAASATLNAQGVHLQSVAGPRNLCYLIYTSGSTGRPKGVVVEHRAVVNRLYWMQSRYNLGADDVVLQKTPYSFDVSVWEFFWPLMTGASVVFAAPGGHKDVEYLEALINQAGVTTLHFVPSMLHSFIESARGSCGGVRQIFCSGEALDKHSVDRYRTRFANASLHNLYGPTEAAIDVTACDCSDLKLPFVPIGAPIANTQIYILDAYNQPQPIGVPGQLHIAGDGLARGYLNRPELTREKFVDNPFTPGQRMYKTGDLARWLEDGNIQYLGRMDTQVKIRGLRIELGEIEACLNQHPQIEDSVVVARNQGADRQLVAFYRARKTQARELVQLDSQQLRAHVLRTLPDYMMPAAFVSVAEIPLSTNGKVDRAALERMPMQAVSDREFVSPGNDTERQLAEIWAEVLKLEPAKIGIHDNFFELGGHSLLAVRVLARLRQSLSVELSIRELFMHPELADLARVLEGAAHAELPPITAVDRGERLPLSFAQQRLWFLAQLEGADGAYNMPGALRLKGRLDRIALGWALDRILARHEALRTTFRVIDDGPVQQIAPVSESRFLLIESDLSGHVDVDGELLRLAAAEAKAPFDLERGPVIRGRLARLSEMEHALLITAHHIVADGWSMGILIRELSAFYSSYPSDLDLLPALAIQYADFAVWQRRWIEGEVLQRQATYWKSALAGAPALLELPYDHPRPAQNDYAGSFYKVVLDTKLTTKLKQLGQRHGTTLFMTLLAAWAALLSKLSNQQDVVIGTPTANRSAAELEGLIGFFVNTLPLRFDLSESITVSELLAQSKAITIAAQHHQDIPFEQLVELAQPVRSLAHSPVFQVMFAWQYNTFETLQLADLELSPLQSPPHTVAKFDLTLSLQEEGDTIAGGIEFATSLFEPPTIARYLEYFRNLLEGMVADDNEAVNRLRMLPASERHRIVDEWNQTDCDFSGTVLVHELFEQQVLKSPDAVAVVFGEQTLSYAELNRRANKLAWHLRELGVGPYARVAVCAERGFEMIIALLAVLKAGGAYVPLDPTYPLERLRFMYEDSGPVALLTYGPSAVQVKGSGEGSPVLDLANIGPWQSQSEANIDARSMGLTAHHLAYVLYTSGSTGSPKGVMVEHEALGNFMLSMRNEPGIDASDSLLAVTTFAFDIAALEIYLPLIAGGRLVLLSRTASMDAAAIEKELQRGITMMQATPATWRMLVNAGWRGTEGLKVLCGGEALDDGLAKSLIARAASVWNMYGPTETTIWSLIERVGHSERQVAIGRPIANTRVYILDAMGDTVPIGVTGEICIGGKGVARGYLNRPELTNDKFVVDPFSERSDARIYRTGDLGRWLPDGTIECLGRNDFQVKVRGYRIELGEIEARLAEHPSVRESVVIVREDRPQDRRLVAYYTSGERQETFGAVQMRSHLSALLPEYMVPAAYVRMQSLPRTPNGKLDRKSLPAPDGDAFAIRDYEAPAGEIETKLVGIWADLLKLAPDEIGIHDNFFELGGHSLLATQLIAKIHSSLGVDLPLKAIFEQATVSGLAGAVAAAGKSTIGPIQRADRDQLERLPLSFSQERVWFFEQLDPGSCRFNSPSAVRITGQLNLDQLEEAFNRVIARHEILRTVFLSREGWVEQRIMDRLDFKLKRISLSQFESREDRDGAARRLCQADAVTPFDLARGPLLRGQAIELAEGEYILMLNMHHIVTDGWSMGVLIAELDVILDAFRSGREPVLEPLPIQYVDYTIWQRTRLEAGGVLKKQLVYWRRKLAGLPESINLVTDYPRAKERQFAAAGHKFMFDPALTGKLKALAERKGGTLYMALLAAFKVLLHCYSGQKDICVGSVIANRQHAEATNLIGMFVNMLAMRSQLDGEDTFSAFLSQVKSTCLEAYENQDTPFEKVVEALGAGRNPAANPIFQVMLILHNARIDNRYPAYEFESQRTELDLTFQFTESGEGLSGSIEYSTALFSSGTITRMAGHFESLCRAIVATPTARIRDLDYLGAAEREQVLRGFNATSCSYPSERCLHDFFVDRALLCPTAVAARYGQSCLTYGELYERSGALGVYLQSLGVCADAIVGVCVERSLEMMVALVGSVRAGAAYLPADPDYPDDRLEYMLHDSGARVVLTQHRFSARLRRLLGEDVKLICLDAEWGAIAAASATLNAQGVHLQSVAGPRNLCYLIYTSGSTGRPKGVVVEHRAVVNRLYWMQSRYNLGAEDVVLQKTPYSFDVSVWEFFWPLMTGASVVFAAPGGHKDVEYLEALINQAGVTTLHFVPSMLHSFIESARGSCGGVRQIFCSGEALDKHSVDRYRTRFANASLHNLYGPTEAAIDVTACDCSDLKLPFVPIGAPIANTQIYILDAYNQPQPIGVPGQLHIAGDGLARGYLNRPELTREKFVDNPFTPGQRMYKTGDLARWLEDGNIQYLGRMDTPQSSEVKEVEPIEVERLSTGR